MYWLQFEWKSHFPQTIPLAPRGVIRLTPKVEKILHQGSYIWCRSVILLTERQTDGQRGSTSSQVTLKNKMWSSTGKSLLRCRLAQMQRASFFLAYCFYWDAKKSVLSPLKSDSYQSLNFHGFYVVTTFFVMPVLTMRSVVLLLSVSEDEDKLMVSMTFLGTALIWVIIPHLRMFGRPPEREGFVSCVNTMFVLEEKLKGM